MKSIKNFRKKVGPISPDLTEDIFTKYTLLRTNEIHTKSFHIPAPFHSSLRINDELEPSQYYHIEFDGIHDSYYIGINNIIFYDEYGKALTNYENVGVDEKVVDGENVMPAFPPNGWWAVAGTSHSLVFDFGQVVQVTHVEFQCANASATPKVIRITDAMAPVVAVSSVSSSVNNVHVPADESEEPQEQEDTTNSFDNECYFQIAGKIKVHPNTLSFLPTPTSPQIEKQPYTNLLSKWNSDKSTAPENGFTSLLSDDAKYCFVFYRKGHKTRAMNYYLGGTTSSFTDSTHLAKTIVTSSSESTPYSSSSTSSTNDSTTENNNNTSSSATNNTTNQNTIENVAKRAMTLEELRAVRAIIITSCIKQKWKSSKDGTTPLRPDDVTLYDLNSILIKPLTKKRNCSFKELFCGMNGVSCEAVPTFYCSHWWGERVLDFIRCCEYHAMSYNLKPYEAKYWVCAYANRQHDLGTDLGTNPDKSSFREAMRLATKGVLLILDPHAVVFSRIWVDFELFKTIQEEEGGEEDEDDGDDENGSNKKKTTNLDIVTHHEGGVHLIADEDLPGETAYQKNRRECSFPFQELICSKGLDVKLEEGDASKDIDKVRILNVMAGNMDNLDDTSVLDKLKEKKEEEESTVTIYETANSSLRAEMALKALSVSLTLDGQSPDNFFGYNLLAIISSDVNRKSIVLDDLASLDTMTDEILGQIAELLNPGLTEFKLDVYGCHNLTNFGLDKIRTIPESLETLHLGVGYGSRLTSKGLSRLAKKMPPNLVNLKLDFRSHKKPDGSFSPPRTNDILFDLATKLAKTLVDVELSICLNGDNGDGLIALATNLPTGVKKFKLKIESWPEFDGTYLLDMAKFLPPSLEDLDIWVWGSKYFEEEYMNPFADEIMKLPHLKQFKLFTSDGGSMGFYRQRTLDLDQLSQYGTPRGLSHQVQ